MATRREIEELKKVLGMGAPVPLTDELAASANVIKATGLERMSPAGIVERLPLELPGPNISQGHALSPQDIGIGASPKKQGFFGKLGSVVSQIGEAAASPAGAKFLGQMAQGFSGPYQHSVGAQLGRFGVAGAEERSETALLAQAMGAETPEAARDTALTATGRELGALTPESRRRVAADLALQRGEGREERGLELQEKVGESLITSREAQVLDAEQRIKLEQDKIKLDTKKLDFAAEQDEWERQFKDQQNEWQSAAALSAANANNALAEMRRAQIAALEAGRTTTGGIPGGRGSAGWYQSISSMANTHSKAIDDYNMKAAILSNHLTNIASLKPKEDRGKLTPVEERELEASRAYVKIHEPDVRRQQDTVFKAAEILNSLLTDQGATGEMDLSGGGEEGEMTTGATFQAGGETDLDAVATELISAIRAKDPQKTIDAATRLYTAGKITLEQFQNAIKQTQ